MRGKASNKVGGKARSSSSASGSGGIRAYLNQSRDLFTSLILVLPLFVIYQFGVLTTGGVRNGVDFVTTGLWQLAGGSLLYYGLINLAFLVAFGVVLFVMRKRGQFHPKIWPWVLAESTLYAVFFGSAVIGLMRVAGLDVLLASGGVGFEPGPFRAFILSIGAGVYEELVFRLLGMGGLFWLGWKGLKLPKWGAAIGAVLLSSLIFSAIHYVGVLGDPFELGSFMYRFVAGILLAGIFYLRGFAVAVYTHAIYDIIVMVFRT